MAPAKSQGGEPGKRKRISRKKARTQVSSSESSDTSSSSDSESEVEIKKKVKKEKKAKKAVAEKAVEAEAEKDTGDEESEKSESESAKEPKPEPKITFSAWYLRQVAKELEEDLDKVRSAGDFSNSSLPVLINALQQGASTFTDGEKKRIIEATS